MFIEQLKFPLVSSITKERLVQNNPETWNLL